MQTAVSVLLSMDLIPEGRFGYTTEEHAQRLTCSATILEMAAFSLLLSYLFSHRSMTHGDHHPTPQDEPIVSRAVEHSGEVEEGSAHGGGAARTSRELRARGALFEQMIGETTTLGHRRSTATEGVSLVSVRLSCDPCDLHLCQLCSRAVHGMPS